MKLMLCVIFLSIAVGLYAPRIRRREWVTIFVLMFVMAALYYRFGERFM
ncbi:MAG: hypothetical protein AB7P40_08400 [Chloroflexota bacterium]